MSGNPAEKHIQALGDGKLNISQPCTLIVNKTAYWAGCIDHTDQCSCKVGHHEEHDQQRKVFIPLYSVLVRLHLEMVSSFRTRFKSIVEKLERIQRRATKRLRADDL